MQRTLRDVKVLDLLFKLANLQHLRLEKAKRPFDKNLTNIKGVQKMVYTAIQRILHGPCRAVLNEPQC